MWAVNVETPKGPRRCAHSRRNRAQRGQSLAAVAGSRRLDDRARRRAGPGAQDLDRGGRLRRVVGAQPLDLLPAVGEQVQDGAVSPARTAAARVAIVPPNR